MEITKNNLFKPARSYLEGINYTIDQDWFNNMLKGDIVSPLLGNIKEIISTQYTKKNINIENIQKYQSELYGGEYKPSQERRLVFNTIHLINNLGGWEEVNDISYENVFMRYAIMKGYITVYHKYPYLKNVHQKMIIPKFLGHDEYVYVI